MSSSPACRHPERPPFQDTSSLEGDDASVRASCNFDKAFQSPTAGSFRQAGTVAALRAALGLHLSAELRLYVIATVTLRDGLLMHAGSGPNLEGGVITLCTCKHAMRASPSVTKGTWVAAVTSASLPLPGQALFYLARVNGVAMSHVEQWASLPPEVRRVKSMVTNPLGDLLEPTNPAQTLRGAGIEAYRPFQVRHSHGLRTGRELSKDSVRLLDDLCYTSAAGERARLLRFDPAMSWVWERPLLLRAGQVGRGHRRLTVGELLECLRDADAP